MDIPIFRLPNPASRPPRAKNFIAYLQVVKDDLCLFEVCEALLKQGVIHFAFFQPSHYWSGEIVPDAHKEEILAIIRRLSAGGANCYFERRDVAPFIRPKRIDTETGFRNSCIARLRKLKFNHILIVDGDELWFPGSFAKVLRLVNLGARAISAGMIPVVGIPPYPVEGALDRATVYVGPGVTLINCRQPRIVHVSIIKEPLLYHFTGVRPTMEENILKHRRSGHYDDPAYDYEGWLKNRLPNLKPGDKDIHFYRNYQIWPGLRDWFPGEKELLPASVFSATK
jgi:hypothetical protein